MFNTYRVAVRLSLTENVALGLGNIARHLAGVNKGFDRLQERLNKIKKLTLVGTGMTAAGAFGLGIFDKMLKPATEYAHQLQQMNLAGMKHIEIIRATQAAWDATRTAPATSVSQNLAAIRELRMVFGDTRHAIENVATVQKMQAILQNMRGGRAGDEAYTIAKALELKGAVRTPGEFVAQADLMMKAMAAAGGKVVGTDFLQAFKYGRTATAGWSDAFTYTILPTLIQEMKSSGGGGGTGGPGNALMSAFSAIVGGTISQKALGVWQRLGLIDMNKAVWTTTHHLKGLAPGGIRGAALFQANPFEWTQQFLIPALAKAGYQTPEQQRQALQYLFPNRTAGFVMTQMATQAWKFKRDMGLIGQARGLSEYEHLLKNDPVMARQALTKQWESLLAILGYQIMPTLLSWTQKLIGGLRELAGWFHKHATLAKALMVALGGLSAALVVGGAIKLTAAAFQGLGLVLTAGGGLAGMLGGVATALGAVAVVVPTILAAAGAGYLGYKGGGYLNSGISWGLTKLRGRDTSLGTLIYEWAHPSEGNSYFNAAQAAKTRSLIHNHIHVDGHKIASIVTQRQSDTLFGPQRGSSAFDMSMMPPTVGLPIAGR